MKVIACDVCYADGGKIVKAAFRSGTRGLKLDLCKEHQMWSKGMRVPEFIKKATELFEKHTELDMGGDNELA